MAEIPIIRYGLAWQPATNTGRIVLRIQGDNTPVELEVETAGEFAALAAILDREAVFYDDELGTIRTSEQLITGS